MFESKYSKLLTTLLIVGIIVIVLAFVIAAFFILRSSRTNREAGSAVSEWEVNEEEYSSYVPNSDKNRNTTTDVSTNVEIPVSEIPSVTNSTTNTVAGGSSTKNRKMYKGFPTIGTIEIPAINLSYPVLLGGDKAMEVSIIVYDPNQTELNITGNVTLAGHNYRDGRFFANNKKLVEGDKIYITDENGRKVTYVVYKIYTTTPEDSSHLDRDTEGKREITLSTCTDDTQSRLIIWAREQ